MDKLTALKIIDLIDKHLVEINALPGQPVGKAAAIEELKMLKNEILREVK